MILFVLRERARCFSLRSCCLKKEKIQIIPPIKADLPKPQGYVCSALCDRLLGSAFYVLQDQYITPFIIDKAEKKIQIT